MCLKLGDAKFQQSSARETFSNLVLNEGGQKNVRFQQKIGHISEAVRDRVTNRKHTLFQMNENH